MDAIYAFVSLGASEINAIGVFLDFPIKGALICFFRAWKQRLHFHTWIIPYEFGEYRVTLL